MEFFYRLKEYFARNFEAFTSFYGLALVVFASWLMFTNGASGHYFVAIIVGIFLFLQNGLSAWRREKAYNAVYRPQDPREFSDRQNHLLFCGALLRLNESRWVNDPKFVKDKDLWVPFEVIVKSFADSVKTNAGVAQIEEMVKGLSAEDRFCFIQHLQNMWSALELRRQILLDAKNTGVCEEQYADSEIRRAEENRDILVGVEIYARSFQIYEWFRSSLAFLITGDAVAEPSLRASLWKAANFPPFDGVQQ